MRKGNAMTDSASGAREVCALPADGSTVRLRPACPEDRGQVLRLYSDISADSLRSRFFVVSRRSGEQGAVLLDLRGESQGRAAYRDLTRRLGDGMTEVLVQPMAARGTEMLAGVVQDEVFGALLLFGLGGTTSERLVDHPARLVPLTDTDIHELITTPRCAPLLFGYRGNAPADRRLL